MSIELNGSTGIDFNDGSNQSTAATPYGRKNLIINGDIRIAQRGTSATEITGSGYHTVDRWYTQGSTFGTFTQTQDTDVPSGQGFANSLKMQCTTANASLSAASYLRIEQRIEGQNLQHLKYGTSNAESLTVSFWVKSNKTGTYVCWLYQDNTVRGVSASYTILSSDTWEKKTITFSGDTSASSNIVNDNSSEFRILFQFVAGTNWSSGTLPTSWENFVLANSAVGQVNLADSTSNYINITGVQLEVGDAASDFEFMPYDMELARCMRYYERSTGDGTNREWFSMGIKRDDLNNPDPTVAGIWNFKVTKRANPTVASSGASSHSYHYSIANSTTFSSISWIQDNENSAFFQGELPFATTAHGGLLARDSAVTDWMEADAEL